MSLTADPTELVGERVLATAASSGDSNEQCSQRPLRSRTSRGMGAGPNRAAGSRGIAAG